MYISKGAKIGVFSTASAVDSSLVYKGVSALENLGYQVVLASNYKDNWYDFSGDDKTRAKTLESLFLDPEVDLLLAMRGGYGSLRILEHLDYNIIKQHPKLLIGYSDITSLQIALYKYSNIKSLQSLMLTSNFAQDDLSSESIDSFTQFITNPLHRLITNKFDSLIEGKAEGILLGGNLITLISLMGTPYELDTEGVILYLEEIDEKTYSIDRALTQLRLSEKLNKIKGIVLGTFENCDRRRDIEMTLKQLLIDRLGDLNIPIIMNVLSGHNPSPLTIPMGVNVVLDTHKSTLSLTNSLF